MIVKRFQAPTETEAILKAKDELGSNAVVLNVKTLKQRGVFRLFKKDVVEVTAALEENEFVDAINSKKPVANKGNVQTINRNMVSSSTAMPRLDEESNFNNSFSSSRGGINLVADDNARGSADTSAIEQKLDVVYSNQIAAQRIRLQCVVRKNLNSGRMVNFFLMNGVLNHL